MRWPILLTGHSWVRWPTVNRSLIREMAHSVNRSFLNEMIHSVNRPYLRDMTHSVNRSFWLLLLIAVYIIYTVKLHILGFRPPPPHSHPSHSASLDHKSQAGLTLQPHILCTHKPKYSITFHDCVWQIFSNPFFFVESYTEKKKKTQGKEKVRWNKIVQRS